MTEHAWYDKFCILGAGPSGLTVAKNFRQHGIACDVIEREDDVGGNWYYGAASSSVYQSVHLISSKPLTEYTDYPIPRSLPDFPSREQVLTYLRSYARQFDLYEAIEFNTSVARIDPAGDGWDVTLADGATRRYRGVVIASGHHHTPKWPSYPGEFSGLTLHSKQYKTPDIFTGRRVLVVGGGNSGCDIAVEAAAHAARAFHSLRRGYHYLPKYLRGKPIDQCGERLLRYGLPLWLRRLVVGQAVRFSLGLPTDYGLKAPDHKLLETHPIINSTMFDCLRSGQLAAKPDVRELAGDRARFVDGSEEPIDVIVYATGFELTFPFIDRVHLNWRGDCPRLYLNVFHPRHDHLFVAGLIQPDSGMWGLVDRQAQLMARFIVAQRDDPRRAAWFRRLKATHRPDLGNGIRYVGSPRHLVEVEHFTYRERLRTLIAKFD